MIVMTQSYRGSKLIPGGFVCGEVLYSQQKNHLETVKELAEKLKLEAPGAEALYNFKYRVFSRGSGTPMMQGFADVFYTE